MRKNVIRLIHFVLAFMLLVSITPPADAALTRASDYFWRTEAWATPTDSGNFIGEFDVSATTTMKEVGASKIVIYEQQSNGTYKSVKTFTRYNTTGMIKSNTFCAYGKVSYSGTSGTKYYAVVTFYAKDANGSETLNMTTKTITA